MTQNLRLCPVRDNISVEIVHFSTTERAVRYAIFRTLYSVPNGTATQGRRFLIFYRYPVPTGRLFQCLHLFTIYLTLTIPYCRGEACPRSFYCILGSRNGCPYNFFHFFSYLLGIIKNFIYFCKNFTK